MRSPAAPALTPISSRPDDPLEGYRLIIIPSAAGHSHFNQPQWECIRARVAEGATLYVSSAGAVLPGINEMAGIEVQYRQGVTGERVAHVITRSEGLPPGHVLRWEGAAPLAPHIAVTDGTIIAESADGRAFLVEHRWQRGSVVFCAEPVERYLCGKPGVARSDETWRLYRYLKSVAGIRAVVEAEQPDIECGLLREGDRLLAVLVNHSEEPLEARLAVDGSIHALEIWTDGAFRQSQERAESRWKRTAGWCCGWRGSVRWYVKITPTSTPFRPPERCRKLRGGRLSSSARRRSSAGCGKRCS